MGPNEWREAEAWPPAAIATTFYLTPGPERKPGSLTISKTEAKERFTTFVADPTDPVVNEYRTSGAHDYMEVTGPIHAHNFISRDCRDLALWVRVLDTAPDGTAYNLMSPGLDVQRASYRELRRGSEWLTPRKIYPIDLNNLITSNTFLAGHRISVQIAGGWSESLNEQPQPHLRPE